MSEVVRIDDPVRVNGRDIFADLNRVRTHVRKNLYGRTEPVGAILEVIYPSGEIEEWEFDHHVGYPIKPKRDWMREWAEQHN